MKRIILLLPLLLLIGCKAQQQPHPRALFGHSQKITLIADTVGIIKKNEHIGNQDKDDWLDPSATYEKVKDWAPLDYDLSIELCDTVIILKSKIFNDEFTPEMRLGENPNMWIWKNEHDELLVVRVQQDYDRFWIQYLGKENIYVFKVNRILN